ncbi:hypothetical protein [Synechococcus sp. UW179A]|uniref:hypothetical protein n=1 Tax=Synechococcus sp. UW179A TaxID=2575510 RepID=UPI001482BC2F|nr:hypothetical protein [Synechococcus sp. UW179A]
MIVVVPVAVPPAFALIDRLVAASCVLTVESPRTNRYNDPAGEVDQSDRPEPVQVVSGSGFCWL